MRSRIRNQCAPIWRGCARPWRCAIALAVLVSECTSAWRLMLNSMAKVTIQTYRQRYFKREYSSASGNDGICLVSWPWNDAAISHLMFQAVWLRRWLWAARLSRFMRSPLLAAGHGQSRLDEIDRCLSSHFMNRVRARKTYMCKCVACVAGTVCGGYS